MGRTPRQCTREPGPLAQLQEWEEESILSTALNFGRLCHFHVPNEMHRAMLGRSKKKGLWPGCPDHFIATPPPKYPDARGVFVEIKAEKPLGKPPKARQLAVHAELRTLGYIVICDFGASACIRQLKQLGYRLPL